MVGRDYDTREIVNTFALVTTAAPHGSNSPCKIEDTAILTKELAEASFFEKLNKAGSKRIGHQQYPAHLMDGYRVNPKFKTTGYPLPPFQIDNEKLTPLVQYAI